jgi:hypothetical protein
MRALVLASVLSLLAAAPAWAQAAPSKCNAAKYKATGAYAQSILACQSKALAKGTGLDLDCLGKAIAKLEKAFEKAARKGDCNGSDGAATAQGQADVFRISLGESLLPPLRCCAFTNACGWAVDEAACTGAGGTAGAEGTNCHGNDGTCAAGAPSSGPCCETPDATCTAGPDVTIEACTATNGNGFVDGGTCLATGECVPH